MARGSNLTAHQVSNAIAYNRARHSTTLFPTLLTQLGLPNPGLIDEAFVRFVADWQEDNIGIGEGDGKIGPRTEGYLNIQHPLAGKAAEKARAIQSAGNILFDSWGNDVRDNDNDGRVDVGSEANLEDGAHFTMTFARFAVVAGRYEGLGWTRDQTVEVATSKTVDGPFRYRVCADVVSQAYHEAGVMPAARATMNILQKFREKGYVWRRDDRYPTEYLPGDFVCTLPPSGAGEGHSGIVVTRSPTSVMVSGVATRQPPQVVELPGPSTMVQMHRYDPTRDNDVTLGPFSKDSPMFRGIPDNSRWLGRLLLSKLRG